MCCRLFPCCGPPILLCIVGCAAGVALNTIITILLTQLRQRSYSYAPESAPAPAPTMRGPQLWTGSYNNNNICYRPFFCDKVLNKHWLPHLDALKCRDTHTHTLPLHHPNKVLYLFKLKKNSFAICSRVGEDNRRVHHRERTGNGDESCAAFKKHLR